ncbi:MAG TPA: hypothetical protein VER11_01840 [Polyangiaceae bacterium]|nr:hypothetical protein [Polyangiaceae bacterium]
MTGHAPRALAHGYLGVLLVTAVLAAACAGSRTAVAPPTTDKGVSNDVARCPQVAAADARSLVDKYCVSCHSPTGSAGEDYDFRGDAAIIARRRNIEAKLRLRAMPPPSAPQPSAAERASLRCWAKQ